jgi:hypothetical protein
MCLGADVGTVSRIICTRPGALGSMVETLYYKPEGRGFDFQCHWIFQLT